MTISNNLMSRIGGRGNRGSEAIVCLWVRCPEELLLLVVCAVESEYGCGTGIGTTGVGLGPPTPGAQEGGLRGPTPNTAPCSDTE